jgi:hypothetical protein
MNGPQQTNKKLYNNSTLIQANHLFHINEPNPNKESDLTTVVIVKTGDSLNGEMW